MKKFILLFVLVALLLCGCKSDDKPVVVEDEVDQAKVNEVVDSISFLYDDIDNIHINEEETRNEIARIRTLYDELNEKEKALIENYSALEELEALVKKYNDEQEEKKMAEQKKQEAVEAAYNMLDEKIAKYYEDDFDLPRTFEYDETTKVYISWNTSDPNTISTLGVVTRPRVNNAGVTLTATISCGSVTKEFKRSIKIPFLSFEKLPSTPVFAYFFLDQSSLTEVEASTIDVVNLSFGNITTDGSVTVGGLAYNKLLKERDKGIRIMFSVQNKTGFKTYTKTAALREQLVDNFISTMTTYHFDGIDIDWEYPEGDEVANYTEFMKLLYTKVKALSRDYLVTTAVYGGNGQSHYNVPETQKYVDYMHLMTYDLNAPEQTSHVTSLSGKTSVVSTVAAYNNSGVPYSKLVIGAAFYGKKYKLPEGSTSFYGVNCDEGAVTIKYKDIKSTYLSKLDSSDNIKRVWDSSAQAPYLCITNENGNNYFITYDDVESVTLKAEYVLENKLAGIMFWDLGEEDRTTNDLVGAIKSVIKK